MVKGVDVAAEEATAWTTFGNELAELVGKLQSGLGDLGGLTNLPTSEHGYFGSMGTEVPRHGVNGEEMISHLTALMRDSRAIGRRLPMRELDAWRGIGGPAGDD